MPTYRYRALDADGRRQGGLVEAEAPRAARALLRERGLFPLDLHDAGARRGLGAGLHLGRPFGAGRRLRPAELCLLTRQWSALLESGLTMEQALTALIDQAERPAVAAVLAGVRAEILAGHALRAALDGHAGDFPAVYRAAIGAGETAGQLVAVMGQLADHLERREALRQKTLQALLYPAIVALVALLVVVGLMSYVVPAVLGVLSQNRQALPWLTRALIAVSWLLREWGWLLALLLAAGWAAAVAALRREPLRRAWDARLLRLPGLGRYLRTLETARLASTLSILVGSGVPLLAALDAGRQVLARRPLADALAAAAERVREGAPLSRALARDGQFPPLLCHMIASGEATGRLGAMLARAARLQQDEIERRTTALTTLLEPVLLLAMGGLVLLIVLAVMQPVIAINQLVH